MELVQFAQDIHIRNQGNLVSLNDFDRVINSFHYRNS